MGPLSQVTKRSQFETMAAKSMGEDSKTLAVPESKASTWTNTIANDERYKYFKTDLPTSALIVVKRLADEDLVVEIECVAVIPTERSNRPNQTITGLLLPRSFERRFLIFSACTEQITSRFSPAHLSEM
jgi:hypothetical protein